MATDNVELFERAVEAIADQDIEAVVELMDPEAVLEPLRAATEGAYRGHEGTRRFMADTAKTFDAFEPEYTDIRDLGDRVLAIGSIRIRGANSGAETRVPSAAIAEYRDGLCVRYRDYGDAREALRAAGLEP